jgi:hypothetical protein
MQHSPISIRRPAVRGLCTVLLLMGLFDAPVAVTPAAGWAVAALLGLGALAGCLLYARTGSTRSGPLVRPPLQSAGRAAAAFLFVGGVVLAAWLEIAGGVVR